jgi:hypothetical protein
MTTEYLMTGAVGIDNDAWQSVFYDDDLPADWRIAYYSSLLRSVLLPQHEWSKAVDQRWYEEVDEGFHFVLYANSDEAGDMTGVVNELEALPDKFSARIAGAVLKPAATSPAQVDELRPLIERVNSRYPVAIDAGGDVPVDPLLETCCVEENISLVWYPGSQEEPGQPGKLLVTLIDSQTLREQREIIEKIRDWMAGGRMAGLFNISPEAAPVNAQETRVLAELMGV